MEKVQNSSEQDGGISHMNKCKSYIHASAIMDEMAKRKFNQVHTQSGNSGQKSGYNGDFSLISGANLPELKTLCRD